MQQVNPSLDDVIEALPQIIATRGDYYRLMDAVNAFMSLPATRHQMRRAELTETFAAPASPTGGGDSPAERIERLRLAYERPDVAFIGKPVRNAMIDRLVNIDNVGVRYLASCIGLSTGQVSRISRGLSGPTS